MKQIAPLLFAVAFIAFALFWPLLLPGCGPTLGTTLFKGSLGGLYGACQTVDSDDATWRKICDGVSRALPHIGSLGAGPAELSPDEAAREVTIIIED